MLSGLIAAFAALALAAVPADRMLAAAVRRRVASAVQAASRAAAAPAVSFAGSAFLPQLLAGRFREVEVAIGACAPGGVDLSGLTARLTEVRAPLLQLARSRPARSRQGSRRARSRQGSRPARSHPAQIIAGGIEATAVIGLAALSARLPSGLRLKQHGRDLRITGTYLLVPVRGTLAVTASRDQITVTPKLTGVTAPIGFVIALPGLPRQLAVTAVEVTGAGLRVRLTGEGVELLNPAPEVVNHDRQPHVLSNVEVRDSTGNPEQPRKVTDEALVRALYGEHASPLLSYALHLTSGDRQRAEDIVQETLLRAWLHPEAVAGRPARPWLFAVARNLAIDAHRARQARPRETGDAALGLVTVPDGADEAVESWAVAEALRSLRLDHRVVLLETYYHGRTVAQTAAILGIPPGTVKSRTFYALRALKLALEERGLAPS